MRRIALLATAVAVAGAIAATPALGHTPTVSNSDCSVRGWTHADNRDNPAIGIVAFVQNRNGIVRGIGHGNTVYKFRAPWPQVACVPATPTWNSTGGLRTVAPAGQEWWWSRAGGTPGGGEAIALYDNRPFVPGSGPSNFSNFVVLGPNETTIDGPLDGNVRFFDYPPVETVVLNPPADFIRPALAPAALALAPAARTALAPAGTAAKAAPAKKAKKAKKAKRKKHRKHA